MEQLSQSPFFPVPVRWFEIPMQTVRWGLGHLAQSSSAAPAAASFADPAMTAQPEAATTRTDAAVAPQSEFASADTSTDSDRPTVGVFLNEYA